MIPATRVRTDVVLIGGGHAHVHVLKALTVHPEPGVRLTLIARDLESPYSGMVPGLIAGCYSHAAAHLDLVRLCGATGARLIPAEAIGLDRSARRVLLAHRPPVAYDVVSLDVGISPDLSGIDGAEHGIAVKPIGSLLQKLDDLLARCKKPGGPRRIAIVGGGAGGVELLLSVRARILAEAEARERQAFSFRLITDGEILATHHARTRKIFRRILSERAIALNENCRVHDITPDRLLTGAGEFSADAVLITTQAAAPAWFANTGLARDANGFVAVTASLQSTNDPDVFAAGDCAALPTPREMAGVYAVRAGPPLADNLRRRALGQPLRDWRPQRHHLSLISTGERYAVASRGALVMEGAWLWSLKDWIDRRWMRKYQELDSARMPPMKAVTPSALDQMRCGGCAAKVGPGPLSRALARLDAPVAAASVIIGLEAPDDAAVVSVSAGKHLVQTVDFFRAFIDDPYLFGKVAANHALNDIFAMGGEPRHALATAVVPPGGPGKVEEALFQLLAGARATLDREGVALIGGHSSEGEELAVGFSVSGEIAPDKILRKGGLKPGDALILTKPIGTAILFAGAMRGRARARSIAAALDGMQLSNRAAAQILIGCGASAMTDISGFGLAGHLGEMLAASGAEATLDLAVIPVYPGASELARAGVVSSLLPENLALAALLRDTADEATRALVFDPQTSGPLLAGVPDDRAGEAVATLHAAGYPEAAVIGHIGRAGLPARDAAILTTGEFA